MPTINQLPVATQVGPADEIPVSQGGVTRSVTTATLLAGMQTAIILPQDTLLGRVSLGPGNPEPVGLGAGLAFAGPSVAANGGDHAQFASESQLVLSDDVIVNNGGTPKRLAMPLLRSLFAAGNNVAIDGSGTISASTDPSVTAELAALNARIPTGGIAALNAQGQVINPIASDVTQGSVTIKSGVTRSLGTKALDTVNLIDFGAVPGGGDASSAFGAAFAALPASGGEIFIPSGDYLLASSVVLAGKPVVIRGAGKGATRLHLTHSGVGIDLVPGNLLNRVEVRGMTIFPENTTQAAAAAVRVTYPGAPSFGNPTATIVDLECFGYPNAANGVPPFPQTFNRGVVLNGCWNAEISDLYMFGQPAPAGVATSSVLELNQSFDTRVFRLQTYAGSAAVLQTGYCEGIYLFNPLVVGTDYLFTQTNETTWPGYQPNKSELLGFWLFGGEININLSALQMTNVAGGFIVGTDFTRDAGPSSSQTFFDFTNVSNVSVANCSLLGNAAGGSNPDTGIRFQSTWNSSSNIISSCHFENMTTAINIVGSNGTVGLSAHDLQLANVPAATAIVDGSSNAVGNRITYQTPGSAGVAAGLACNKDLVIANINSQTVFQVNGLPNVSNYLRAQPAPSGNGPILAFDGADSSIAGTILTKGGSLTLSAAGGSGGPLLVLQSTANASNWITTQNAVTGSASIVSTSSGALNVSPKGTLSLSSTGGIFLPGLPTSRPAPGSGQIWNNNGVLSVA